MILTQALAATRAQRTQQVLPDGQDIWVSRIFSASAETPEKPMASLVEQQAHTVIPPHFHAVNQFQVVVEGQGILGKRAVYPWTVHYTNGFTGYGPLRASAEGMNFLTLRNRYDLGGARFFPAGQSFMQPAPKRHHLVGPLLLSHADALRARQRAICDTILAPEDDGLAAWFVRLGPLSQRQSPETVPGGGQYLVVAQGTLVHAGAELSRLACVYVSTEHVPVTMHSGAEGLEALILQFPIAEAVDVHPGARPRGRTRRDTTSKSAGVLTRSGSPRQTVKANPEHVAVARQGAPAIAAWRAAHPGEVLHLEHADLAGVNLCGAHLQGARLQEANLHGADLSGANLQQADVRAAMLTEANLTGARLQHASLVRAHLAQACLAWARAHRAHLHGAHLHEADLRQANLQQAYLVSTDVRGADLRGALLDHADLQWANLQEANLTDTRLQEANLHESVLGQTLFGQTSLRQARGLDTCRHQAGSALDRATLSASGVLPAAFLRGCGWSDACIARLSEPGQEPTVYARIERALALASAEDALGWVLLSTVAPLLRQHYPTIPIHCRLERFGPMVRLLIDTPPEQRVLVEQTLQAYGEVLAGSQTPAADLGASAPASHGAQALRVAFLALCVTDDGSPHAARRRSLQQRVGEALHAW